MAADIGDTGYPLLACRLNNINQVPTDRAARPRHAVPFESTLDAGDQRDKAGVDLACQTNFGVSAYRSAPFDSEQVEKGAVREQRRDRANKVDDPKRR